MSDTETGASGHAPPVARPVVGRPATDRGVWIFAILAGLAAVALFLALEARRNAGAQASLEPPQTGGAEMIVAPPPLAIPELPSEAPGFSYWPGPTQAMRPPPAIAVRPPAAASPAAGYAPLPPQRRDFVDDGVQPATSQQSPAMVYQAPSDAIQSSDEALQSGQRVKAAIFANPSTTIPQGAVIHAVLETAVDSTQPGAARAIVSRDVRSFDGSRVLVPRGSRLYGEYKADLSLGQNRALIQWLRLMRPDGVVVALDSPSADTLGRAGVKGKVNSHFFERFGGALLQSALDIGVGLATRDVANDTVVVGLPGSTQSIVAPASNTVRPTLKVAQGTPVSVFVARDLDFSEVEP